MNGSDEKKPPPIPIAADEATLQGQYSNVAMVSFSPFDFTLDFAHQAPNLPAARLKARVVMSPVHMKAYVEALKQNLEKYEAMFGEIKALKQPEVVFETKTN